MNAVLRCACAGLVAAALGVAVAAGAEPVLEFERDGEVREFTVTELLAGSAPLVLELVEDATYGHDNVQHRFVGVPLERALATLGVGPGEHLQLVSTDGYIEDLSGAERDDPRVRGLLAYADEAAPAGSDWLKFEHGGHLQTPAPFYLVWQADDPALAAEAAARPWPYQLETVRVLEQSTRAIPPGDPPAAVTSGYATYDRLCIRCHMMRGRGGTMGPPLAGGATITTVLTDAQLAQRIGRITEFYPDTKMPRFDAALSVAAIDEVVAYLRWMNSVSADDHAGPGS